ncbi:indirect negative regulator of sigma-B activity [Lentibacillus salicampi]|uniref:Indirect negative regulator of sigma-B activity n=1 Tax=Lentibacillus salicampi TaxID=175306 RepID=A0A4Y9A8E2_9BACI|nr:indirect negative regulator of sigma-B activity [Lentibacillus salicampi]
METAVFQKAKKNQYYCGDSYFYIETDDEYVCALADGLGSGEFAKESSEIVISIIRENTNVTVEQLIKKCNQQLSGKRGAVIGILRIDFRIHQYSFSSIGNIGVVTMTEDGKRKRSIPNAGYLAGYHRSFKVVTDKLDQQTRFILFSDGVTDKDLSQRFLLNKDVHQVVQSFAGYVDEDVRADDTTLIAIRYER